MTLRLGVLGFSPGNGHPYSFSAIVNGYDDEAFARVGWDGIHAYLRARNGDGIGIDGVAVQACWMPNAAMARGLALACNIPQVVQTPTDMIGRVDAVMILRDDPESHWELAAPFLEAGVPTFVDKPLCTDAVTLQKFMPHLQSGRLMSCAGLRYARETDDWRSRPEQFGDIRLIRGAVVMDWARYGIHMLEAAMGALPGLRPIGVQRHRADHDSLVVRMADGRQMLIDALGNGTAKTFRVDVLGAASHGTVDISDNFTAFSRTLQAFIEQVRTGVPAIPPQETGLVIRTMIAGLEASPGGPEVPVA